MPDPRASALDKMLHLHDDLLEGQACIEIFRAVNGAYLQHLQGRHVLIRQTFKADAEPFIQAGFKVNTPADAPVDTAIIFATKYREETLAQMAKAIHELPEKGLLIVTASNDLGAASLEKRGEELLGHISTYSKQKCRVFWGRKNSLILNSTRLDEWLRHDHWREVEDSTLVASAGLFSARTIDPGSRLLAEHLPTNLKGCGADFGAGYGFLSYCVLNRVPVMREWHLVDAEQKALEAARINLARRSAQTSLHYHWHDLMSGLPVLDGPKRYFDCIVMNPPFHRGRGSQPILGQTFIQVAAEALKPGGVLYLVANRHLPYEDTLRSQGLGMECLATEQGFKVIAARA